MDLWDDIVKKISDAADYTLKEAGKITDTAKIKLSIASKESTIDDIFLKIGKLHYEEHIDNSVDNGENIKAAFLEIEKLRSELKVLKSQLVITKKYKTCPECGAKIDREMSYCFKCGHEQ